MELFNIGPLELVIILVLALIVFGPERMVKYSRDAAVFIRKIVRSPFWRELVSTTEEIKSIPQQLVKDADLQESMREISQLNNDIRGTVHTAETVVDETVIKDTTHVDNSPVFEQVPDDKG